MDSLLEIRNLRTSFKTEDGTVRAVDDVSFGIRAGQVVGLVGESGCGKTVVSLSILQLLPVPPAIIEGGEIRRIRGNEIAVIFQEPMTSLKAVYTIGNQLLETIELHQNLSRHDARRRAVEMLKLVGIPRPEEVVEEYPHRFSGGMRQRDDCDGVELQSETPYRRRTYHGSRCDDTGTNTRPRADHDIERGGSGRARLPFIPGSVPNPLQMPPGCPFHPRCPSAMPVCSRQMPGSTTLASGHEARCWLHEQRIAQPEVEV